MSVLAPAKPHKPNCKIQFGAMAAHQISQTGKKKKSGGGGGGGGGTLKRPDTVVVGMCMLGFMNMRSAEHDFHAWLDL